MMAGTRPPFRRLRGRRGRRPQGSRQKQQGRRWKPSPS